MLLVLDNCEQLIDGIGWLSELLANAPGIKLLVTSRERLQLAEEWIYDVPTLEDTQAIDLFEQAGQRLNPRFERSAAVLTVCRLVENLPLALELAASWTPFLSCEQIAENIQHDIDFLSANVRNVPERHRSIRAVFDYSWRMLSPLEQTVMMRLSVFRGGLTVEEAEPIAGATLFILRSLVEKSLVRATGQGRYDVHELIRQYAADQLRASGQEFATRRRHSEIYLALAGKLDSRLYMPDGIAAFARLDQEGDNLRAGMTWALETGELDIARRYVDKLFLYWQRRGYWLEGERWAKATLGQPDEADSLLLCWVLLHAAVFMALQGRFAEAFAYKPRAEAMARRLEDPETMLRFFFIEGQATLDISQAEAVWQEFFSIGTQIEGLSKGAGREAKQGLLAGGHFLYGDRLRDAGHAEEAAAHYRQSLELYRQLGNVDLIAYPIGNLGRLALQEGQISEAYARFSESVALSRAIGNRVGIADWMQQLGNAALRMGDTAQAQSCYEEALALYEEMGNQTARADVLADLGYTALVNGDMAQSRQILRASLNAFHQFWETQHFVGIGWSDLLPPEFRLCLQSIALLEVVENRFEQALALLGAATGLRSKFGSGADLGIQARVDAALSVIQSQLSGETFSRAWEAGRSMSIGEIFTLALTQ
jgi:predicted ATPase